ncbi:MAG: YajQ family cyclic di-GMP-binding protein [Fimbriimonadaceae bacterium]|nr:YajQ family cyclic di-GMP-binding protein [Fimbriimonadaceae bacterium]
MAAVDFSFDIVSRADMQEVRNAIDQTQREMSNRFDFRGSKCEVLFEKDDITLLADDDFKLQQVKDILESKFIRRGIDIRQIEYGKAEPATGLSVRQKVTLKQGIAQDQAKALIKQIKETGIKVQAQIQGDEVRVSSKSKDDLQKCITFVKGLDLPMPVDFVNFR